MLKVGITGGIGSGKSTVCALFEVLGIPVFYADDAARNLMNEDAALKKAITALFGESIYANGLLDRPALSAAVFNNPEKLATLNALVHPASIAAGERWIASQKTSYVVKEAAIFFESGAYKAMDVMIGVQAPKDIRIERAMHRSNLTKEEVEARLARQMAEDEKMARCDYVIVNDGKTPIIPQVLRLDARFRNLSH